MYIDIVPNRSSPPAILLRESIREGKRIKKRTIANLSALPIEQAEMIRRVLKGEKLGPVEDTLEVVRSRAHGHVEAAFLKMLPSNYRYAFEFRHASWYGPKILELLRESDVALCLSDHHQAPAPWVVTAGHVYIRGHGPGGRYKDNYPYETLRDWSRSIRRWTRQRREVFVYFDNDQKCAAPEDAQRLIQLVEHGEKSRNHLLRESFVARQSG